MTNPIYSPFSPPGRLLEAFGSPAAAARPPHPSPPVLSASLPLAPRSLRGADQMRRGRRTHSGTGGLKPLWIMRTVGQVCFVHEELAGHASFPPLGHVDD